MKLFAPKYYKDFVCIADKCKNSCCIGWEIDIDDDTMKKYRSLTHSYAKTIKDSIDVDGTPHFKLLPGDRCPHLNCDGLCKIILSLGEDYLCDICREHPRFYNRTSKGVEVGIGISCEEACRIVLSSDGYGEITEIGDIDLTEEGTVYDCLEYRDRIYSVLSEESLSLSDKLSAVCKEFNVTPTVLTDNEWRDVISSLEYLSDSHRDMFLLYSSDIPISDEYSKPLLRAFAYFVYRHCTGVSGYDDFCASLGMCIFLIKLLVSLINGKEFCAIESICDLARIISEEIEYSEDNTDAIKFEFAVRMGEKIEC